VCQLEGKKVPLSYQKSFILLSVKPITESQRYKLEGYLEAGLSVSKIAQTLKKHRATV
jgi:IS30 family transposase